MKFEFLYIKEITQIILIKVGFQIEIFKKVENTFYSS